MNKEQLEKQWLEEERIAHIRGWDFSHIHQRCEEERDLPWDYSAIIGQHLKPEHRLLDLDTGGGEFLRSLNHPHQNTSATEGYPPNIKLCEDILIPLGIDFRPASAAGVLPFKDETFDIVINRHGDFNVSELYRILKPQGIFVTEQVGTENDRELVDLLLPGTETPFPELYLENVAQQFEQAGFVILQSQEAFRPIQFFDVGALVWFARIIEWEFPEFTVERCLPALYRAQSMLEKDGCVEGKIHRFLIVATKPSRETIKG